MTKTVIAMLSMLFLFLAAAVFAAGIEPTKSCQQCGMDRVAFAYSRVVITYADGTTGATCSLRCAVDNMRSNGAKKVKSLQVADYPSRRLIDAGSAVWVIGGKKPGVMTSVPKWAFARKDDAAAFVRGYGGRIATLNEALEAARKEK